LEVKYQLLLQYIANLAFIIQLKLSGKQVESHPVVQSLIELRVMLEKMKPVEQKLKYQIDKVVRTAVVGDQDNEANNGAASAGMVFCHQLSDTLKVRNLIHIPEQ
jgi:U3 small nucleolar ribonucleoprotein protein LCP5